MIPTSTTKPIAVSAIFCAAMLFSTNLFGVEEPAPLDEVQQTLPAAQEIDQLQTRVRGLLSSDSIKDQEWGVYYVGQYRMKAIAKELVPLLIDSIQKKHERIINGCVDGLMQTGQAVDNNTLNNVWSQGSQLQAILLASIDPIAAGPFLASKLKEEIARTNDDARRDRSYREIDKWEKRKFTVLCNLLLHGSLVKTENRQRFVQTALPYIQPVLNVHIELPPDERVPEKTIGIGAAVAGEFRDYTFTRGSRHDTSLPPPINFHLTFSPQKSDTLFAQGPEPLYLHRGIDISCLKTEYSNFNHLDYMRDCLIWLVNPIDLQHVSDQDSPYKLSGYTNLYWTTKEEFSNKIQTAAVDVRSPWVKLFEQLKGVADLPEDATADALFPVKIIYTGHKEIIKVPLPSVYKDGKLSENYLSP